LAVIKDVANYANLSVAAVSKYLKNPDSVRADTRRRIEEAIQALHYVPSAAARSLRTGLTGMLYVVSPNITNPFFAQLFRCLQSNAFRRGYTTVLQTLDMVRDDGTAVGKALQPGSAGLHVDGLIVCFPDDEKIVDYVQQRWKNTPCMYLTWKPLDHRVKAAVLLDVENAMYIAAKHLLEEGHRRIAYVGAPESSITSREKFKGCLRALHEAGLEIQPEHVYHGPYSMETGWKAVEHFLTSPVKPTAILTESDEFAIGCTKRCIRGNVRVPEDIAVVGFDDIPIARMYEPPLTTVRLPLEDMARAAVDGLLDMIEKKTTEATTTPPTYQANLVLRDSTIGNCTYDIKM